MKKTSFQKQVEALRVAAASADALEGFQTHVEELAVQMLVGAGIVKQRPAWSAVAGEAPAPPLWFRLRMSEARARHSRGGR